MVDLPAKLNPKLDKLRALKAGKLSSEPFTVSLRTRTFASLTDGYTSESIVPLLADGVPAPVRVLSQREIALSGGELQEMRLEITLTPEFGTGGYAPSQFDPPAAEGIVTETVYIVKGPNLPASGTIFTKVSTEVSSFVIKLTLRNTGASP